jgi:hypothetical protein
MFVSVCTDTLLYLTWMPDCGAPVRIVTYYAVEFLAVYMLCLFNKFKGINRLYYIIFILMYVLFV